MVRLHVKSGDTSQFLYDTTVETEVNEVLTKILEIYNGRLKISRVCSEIEMLAKHGTTLPPNMQGLTDDQIIDLKLKDEWAEKCIPSGGSVSCKDDIGRRNGNAPKPNMAELLQKTVEEAKAAINKKHTESNSCVTMAIVKEMLDQLRGAVTIVYPMGLPPHDPIRLEFQNEEDLSGTQASKEVIAGGQGCLWWAGKELKSGKKLSEFVGKNDKTKLVVKLQKRGMGPPGREPIVNEDQKKQMMLQAYRRQEELKKLENDENDHMESNWADSNMLKRQFQGLNNVKWAPGRGFK